MASRSAFRLRRAAETSSIVGSSSASSVAMGSAATVSRCKSSACDDYDIATMLHTKATHSLTSWLLCPDIAGVVIVYYRTSSTNAREQALPTS